MILVAGFGRAEGLQKACTVGRTDRTKRQSDPCRSGPEHSKQKSARHHREPYRVVSRVARKKSQTKEKNSKYPHLVCPCSPTLHDWISHHRAEQARMSAAARLEFDVALVIGQIEPPDLLSDRSPFRNSVQVRACVWGKRYCTIIPLLPSELYVCGIGCMQIDPVLHGCWIIYVDFCRSLETRTYAIDVGNLRRNKLLLIV